jgi:hypothetical protein
VAVGLENAHVGHNQVGGAALLVLEMVTSGWPYLVTDGAGNDPGCPPWCLSENQEISYNHRDK